MEKRIFLAVVISIALLAGWSVLLPKIFPELAKKPEPVKTSTAKTDTAPTPAANATATSGTGGAAAASAPGVSSQPSASLSTGSAATAPQAPVSAAAVQTTTIDNDQFTAVFSNRGAQLVKFELKGYKRKDDRAQPVDLVRKRAANSTNFPFSIASADANLQRTLNSALYSFSERKGGAGERILEYRFSDGRVTATKTFTFDPNRPYLFDFSSRVTPPANYRITIGPGIRNIAAEEVDSAAVITGNGIVQSEGKFDVIPREKGDPFQPYAPIDYIGVEDNYFLTALRPTRGGEGVLDRETFPDAHTKKMRPDYFAGVNAVEGLVEGNAFFGPKETKLLDAYGFDEALQLGWFGMIARLFLVALTWINQYTQNYGFAIIVLTVLIKIALYPLQHKSNVSMKKMQRVAPKIEAIKARYKKAKTDAEQRNKMNMEMMQLYQKEGINPMAGCLPLVLQLPILWGFYNLLSRAIELRGAPWILWIKDLSEKDPTYVLPILMTGTMFLQTYLTPMTGDPAQRKIFLIMPLVFGFLFKDFPSGLVLYWLVQNILTIIQQLIMNKWWKDHPDDKDDDEKKK
jgi:YidC/Oxa1 family membrane protein insertase